MAVKNKSKKMNKNEVKCTKRKDFDEDVEKINECLKEDSKILARELPFAFISNKQFKIIGLMPDKKVLKQNVTIPLKLPSKLLPSLRKIFGLEKLKNDHYSSAFDKDDTFITLISFQRFIESGLKIKKSDLNFPTLQVVQIPISSKKAERFTLYLSETNLKSESLKTIIDSPIAMIEKEKTVTKPTKKRSFFMKFASKKSVPSIEQCSVKDELKAEVTNVIKQKSPNEKRGVNSCMLCGKDVFVAEKIEIGTDMFHSTCFKCEKCSKCLYRGKWNKHEDQYYCDYCYKRIMWPFIRR